MRVNAVGRKVGVGFNHRLVIPVESRPTDWRFLWNFAKVLTRMPRPIGSSLVECLRWLRQF